MREGPLYHLTSDTLSVRLIPSNPLIGMKCKSSSYQNRNKSDQIIQRVPCILFDDGGTVLITGCSVSVSDRGWGFAPSKFVLTGFRNEFIGKRESISQEL